MNRDLTLLPIDTVTDPIPFREGKIRYDKNTKKLVLTNDVENTPLVTERSLGENVYFSVLINS